MRTELHHAQLRKNSTYSHRNHFGSDGSFYNGCRAYGRLIDAGVNGQVVAGCYGHLAVPEAGELMSKTL